MKVKEVCANCEHWQQFPPYRLLPMLEGICTRVEGKRNWFGRVCYKPTRYDWTCEYFLLRNKKPTDMPLSSNE